MTHLLWLHTVSLSLSLSLSLSPYFLPTGLMSSRRAVRDVPGICNITLEDQACDPGREVAHCDLCIPGEWCRPVNASDQSFNASFVCEQCPAGCFQNAPGQHFCFACHGGNYSAACKQIVCQPCEPGHYSRRDDKPHLACDECEPGTNQTGYRNNTCLLCNEPEFCNSSGCIDCMECPVGLEALPNATDCRPCSPGHFRSKFHTTCQPCGLGFHCNATGCPACEVCSAGSFAKSGERVCRECSYGHYQDKPGQSECHKCPTGYYATVMGSEQCIECSFGYYCPTADNPPQPCPQDAYCPRGSEAPSYCPALYNLKASFDGCTMSGGLICIIAATIIANIIIVTVLIWYYYRKKKLYTGETQPLVWRKETLSKDPPVYDGF